MFDIHKVKPIHGWREFFGEVGIIVLGVLIALAFEQAVEWVHWRHKVNQALDAIRGEVTDQYVYAIEARVVAPCIAAQIDALQQRLLGSGDRLDPAPTYSEPNFAGYVLRIPDRNYRDGVWQAANADGVISHLGDETRRALIAAYTFNRQLAELTSQNEAAYQRLLVMSMPIRLDPQVRYSLLQEMNQLRGRIDYMRFVSGQLLGDWHAVDMLPAPSVSAAFLRHSGTVRFCRAHRLPMNSIQSARAMIADD